MILRCPEGLLKFLLLHKREKDRAPAALHLSGASAILIFTEKGIRRFPAPRYHRTMFSSLAVLPPNGLLALAATAIIGLVLLIALFKCNAVVAIVIAALAVGLGSGMPLVTQPEHPSPGNPQLLVPAKMGVVESFEGGVAKTLGGLAMIIGLGTILGKLLSESGAVEVIAHTLVRWLGPARLDYAIMIVAFVLGISIFFNVGIVLLGPIAFMLARQTGTPILRLALPLAAGLSTEIGRAHV